MPENFNNAQEEITKINASLIVAKENEEAVLLTPKEKPVSFFSQIVSVNGTWIEITNTIPPLMIPYLLDAPSFTLQFRSNFLTCNKIIGYGRNIKFTIDAVGEIAMLRESERLCFSDKDNARVKIQHPFDTGTHLWRKIFDLSPGGMSFRSHINSPFLRPNRNLPLLEIYLGEECREKHRGKIIYVKQIVDLKGNGYFQIGVQFCDN